MKLRNLFLGACSALAILASCEQKENLGNPSISLSTEELTFTADVDEQTITLEATRDWEAKDVPEWVAVSPEEGLASADPQTVVVTVLKNEGYDRTADIKFAAGPKSKYLTVYQAGPLGSADALIIYSNNFDISKAQDNNGWPYLDKNYDLWDNKTGSGAEAVEYEFGGKMSVRTSGKASNDNSGYSHYAGSGTNKIFFGAAPSTFKINKITLDGKSVNYTLTYGGQKYLQGGDNKFSFDEFKVYVSNDSQKWVELNDAFPEDSDIDGDWNLATANFTVPAGTTQLGIAFVSTCSSAYSIDDVNLVVGTQEGQVVDFATGTELGGTTPGGNTGGGASDANAIYSNNYDKTAAVQGSNGWPFLDSSDAWKNAAGTGAANVSYASKNVTVRNNSNSDGNFSDYAGSGLNNLFFGKDNPYFATKNIALNGATGLTLTFGTEKYSQTLGSTFTNSEYHIYLSNDGAKWVELTDYTFAGTKDGRWNVATANFTVPAGTESLSICMQVDAASAYRLDDMKLVASEGGANVDFSAAVEKDFNAGSTGGGNEGGETPTPPTPPAGGSSMTIAEVLAASGTLASGSTIEGVVISNVDLNNLTSKKGMYVQDETAGLQFYLAENHTFAFGDMVQVDLSGVTVGAYNGAVQVSGLALAKIAKVSSGNTVTPKSVTMADFMANKYEGQYVALDGVQVVAADLSKTWGDASKSSHVSINMEDANGNKFVVFSSKYSTFGGTAVGQGSGTIKGISSINNGTMQIIFCQESDFAGLTEARFDGAEVTPPAGGDDIEGGDEDPVTPPTGDATVAKLVMNTLGLANAANVDGKEIKVDDNITLVFKKGSASTAPAYYDASQGIRMYQNGATLDVTASSGRTITSIKFTFDYKQWYMAPDSGSLSAEGDVRTWTGSANAVKFTSTGTDKDHRAYVKEIEVTYY